MFLSIHQIGDAARVCDRFVLLSGGRVCGEGTLPELVGARRGAQRRRRRRRSRRGVPCAHVRKQPQRTRRSQRKCSICELCASAVKPFVVLLARSGASWWRRARGGCCCSRWARSSACRSSAPCAPTREASGLNGTAVGVGEAFSPLVGIWAPTFSACELAAVVSAAVRRDPPRVGRPAERRAEDRDAASDVRRSRASRAKAIVLLGGLARRVAARRSAAVAAVEKLRRQRLPAGARDGASRPLLNAGLTIALAAADGVGHRTSVDRRDPDAQRDGRHVDPQLRRRGAGRRLGARGRLHAAGDGRASSSTG